MKSNTERALRLLLCALGLAARPLGAALRPGDRFPNLAMAGLEGPPPVPGARILIVDFWASWCAPCRASFPAYGRLAAALAARGLVVFGVSVDEDAQAYHAFLRHMKPPFAVARDASHALVETVDVPTMPTCYVVDAAGRVRFIHEGYHGAATDEALRREVLLLAAEAEGSGRDKP